ncbi:hypothetical protein Pmani_032966 [Petrolisthes manimaculis]|uniref:Uncharacterized protein n=1 Tax=Petrolisthes manimaculis TaxID=1843537 RepID=A0AAE1TQX8_9EUCA|nr:hypothetical protein Pmani_032966 [Petrolisthes manimaculis]
MSGTGVGYNLRSDGEEGVGIKWVGKSCTVGGHDPPGGSVASRYLRQGNSRKALNISHPSTVTLRSSSLPGQLGSEQSSPAVLLSTQKSLTGPAGGRDNTPALSTPPYFITSFSD